MYNIPNLPIIRQYVKCITTCTNMDRDKKQRAEYDLLHMQKIIWCSVKKGMDSTAHEEKKY